MMRDLDLHVAVCFGDVGRVNDILQRSNASINERNCQGSAPLHMLYHGTTDNLQDGNERLMILHALLNHGADVNARGRWNETPLHVAVRKQRIEAVRLLLENKADPNLRDDDERTPLHLALIAKTVREDTVRLLLQYGADVNVVDATSRTPLIYATRMDRLDLVRPIVEAGAHVDYRPDNDRHGYTALFYACRNQNAETIGFLLEHGADPNLRERRMRMTALHELASSWREHRNPDESWRSTVPSARLLLEHGVDVDARDSEDMTALHLAAHNEDEALIRVLLEAGAYVDARDSYGDTALHQLLDKETDENGRLEAIVRLLVEDYGAELNARNGKGQTPLCLAVRLDAINIVNFVLAKVAGVEEITFAARGETTSLRQWISELDECNELNVAAILGYELVVDRLIESGFDVRRINRSGVVVPKTTLYYAVKAHRFGVVKMLLEAGCCNFDSNHGLQALRWAAFDAEDLELTCLLMEFDVDLYKEDEFGKSTLICALESATTTTNSIKLAYLFIYYYAIDVRSNRIGPSLILKYRELIESNERLSSIYFFCSSKLDELKENEICHNLSAYDVLGKSLGSLVKFLGNGENRDAIAEMSLRSKSGELESYEFIIKIRTDLALERRKLLDSAKKFLNSALEGILKTINYESLPDKILWNIFDFLSVRDLKKISTGS